MPRFTRDEMLGELAGIFLLLADHLYLGAGARAAETFIGFDLLDGERYSREHTTADLARFDITRAFQWAYAAAFRPTSEWSDPPLRVDQMFDLALFLENSPRIDLNGNVPRFATPDGYCRQVAEAVVARWKLEHMPVESPEDRPTFSVRELALLADMTEGAVRNALSDKGENGLRTIPGLKPVKIEHHEALRWLTSRRNFVPSGRSVESEPPFRKALREVEDAEELGRLIAHRIRALGDLGEAPALSEWSENALGRWCRGTFVFEVEAAARLGAALDLDVPLFASKALEVTMRRDRATKAVQPQP